MTGVSHLVVDFSYPLTLDLMGAAVVVMVDGGLG
jgi:hypothetical protein